MFSFAQASVRFRRASWFSPVVEDGNASVGMCQLAGLDRVRDRIKGRGSIGVERPVCVSSSGWLEGHWGRFKRFFGRSGLRATHVSGMVAA